MRHAQHSAAHVPVRRRKHPLLSLLSSSHGNHDARSIGLQPSGENNVVLVANIGVQQAQQAYVDVDRALADKINEFVPQTRRAIRLAARAEQRRSHILASASLAALVGTAATAMAFANPGQATSKGDAQETTTTQLRRIGSSGISRSEQRQDLLNEATAQTQSTGSWQLTDSSNAVDANSLSRSVAANSKVAAWVEKDAAYLPARFNPDHVTGDSGNTYPFSQCTWWVYLRRHQLGLPVGSHMGNGNMWAESARARGYWVDHTARHVGDILVFAASQFDSDAQYGHVAIVEKINPDGSVVTSESGAAYHGSTFSRTFTPDQVAQLQVIHY